VSEIDREITARNYNRENISSLPDRRYRTQLKLLLPDRASVKFDLADEIAIGGGTFRNAFPSTV